MDGTEQSSAEQAATTDETSAPTYVTQADFEAWGSKFASKINGELARLRKRGASNDAAPAPAAASSTEPSSSAPARDALTPSDVAAAIRVGELRASAPEPVREQLAELTAGLPFSEQQRIYEAVAMTATPPAATAGESRGETPVQSTARATTSPKRNSAGPPTSWAAWKKLPIQTKRKIHDDYPDFDPDVLRAKARAR